MKSLATQLGFKPKDKFILWQGKSWQSNLSDRVLNVAALLQILEMEEVWLGPTTDVWGKPRAGYGYQIMPKQDYLRYLGDIEGGEEEDWNELFSIERRVDQGLWNKGFIWERDGWSVRIWRRDAWRKCHPILGDM